MDFAFSSHALERMQHRGIDKKMVESILQDPLQIIIQDTIAIHQSIIQQTGKNYLCRIFVDTEKSTAIIVTVYKTSQIHKYYEGEI